MSPTLRAPSGSLPASSPSETATDDDVIGGGGLDSDGRRPGVAAHASAFSTSSATSSTVLPSVATRTTATSS